MQAQATLIGADGAVELHAHAAVDLHLAVVVHPRNAENDLLPAPLLGPRELRLLHIPASSNTVIFRTNSL